MTYTDVTASYNVSNTLERIGAWSVGVGTANGWAWVGQRFSASGNNPQLAYIRMAGNYKGDMVGSHTGNANVEIMMKVYDVTAQSYIGEITIREENSSGNLPKYLDAPFNNSILVSLQPGHQYVVYVITYGSVAQYGPQGSHLEFGKNDKHTKYNSITIDWQ